MLRRWATIILALLVVGAVAWWLTHRKTDRQLIDELIAKAVHGVETKSLDEIMDCVASDYRDDMGLSKLDMWRAAAQWVRTVDTAEVSIDDYQVDIRPPSATGFLDLRVEVTRNGQIDNLGPMPVTLQFEKQRRRLSKVWLIKSASSQGVNKMLEDYM